MKSDLLAKIVLAIIGALLTAVIGMCGWYLQGVSGDIRLIRDDVQELKVDSTWMKRAIESNAGGDPASVGVPEE